jgi:lipopolysaccharide biosynthesis glycosyltransferase
MKTCFVSTLNKVFLPGLVVLLRSLLKHNPGIDIPYIIFNEGDIDLNDVQKLKNIYINIELREITHNYTGLKFSTVRNWKINPGHRLEILTLEEFDKVIFLDVDMLCRGNIDYLLQCNYDFGAVIDHPLMECSEGHEYIGFNAGLMIIGNRFLNKNYYNKAFKLMQSKTWYGNQGTFNILFAQHARSLSSKYLVTTPYLTRQKLHEAIFVHFVGEVKPWFNCSNKIEDNYDPFVIHNNRSVSGWLDTTNRILSLRNVLTEYKKYIT